VANQWLAVARRFALTEVFRAETIIIMLDRRRDQEENCLRIAPVFCWIRDRRCGKQFSLTTELPHWCTTAGGRTLGARFPPLRLAWSPAHTRTNVQTATETGRQSVGALLFFGVPQLHFIGQVVHRAPVRSVRHTRTQAVRAPARGDPRQTGCRSSWRRRRIRCGT
jgi:hypothetical protein